MKKLFKFLLPLLCLALCLPIFSACGGDSVTKITYTGSDIAAGTVGVAYSVNIGTAEGSSKITYKADSYLPAGLTLSESGVLSGTPTETYSKEDDGAIEITASADGFEDVTVEFGLNIVAGTLSYSGSTLAQANAGESYTASVATATGAVNTVSYALKANSSLPGGLSLSSTGSITGTPVAAVEEQTFTVVASADGYTDKEAEFTLTVVGESVKTGDTIIYEDDRKTIDIGTVYVGDEVNESVTADQIVYDEENNLDTRYKPTFEGGSLPLGLEFEQNGFITGTALDSFTGVLTFKVKACVVTIDKSTTSRKTISGYAETENKTYSSVTITVTIKILDKLVDTNKFEAEWTDLTGKSGSGYSDSGAGAQLGKSRDGASGGYAIGYTNKVGFYIDFVIYSDKATTASLSMTLASEVGEVSYTDDMFTVTLNSQKVEYDTFTLTGVWAYVGPWTTIEVGTINLVEGENTIRLEVAEENTYMDGHTGGPEIDYITVDETDAVLSWRPKMGNTTNR